MENTSDRKEKIKRIVLLFSISCLAGLLYFIWQIVCFTVLLIAVKGDLSAYESNSAAVFCISGGIYAAFVIMMLRIKPVRGILGTLNYEKSNSFNPGSNALKAKIKLFKLFLIFVTVFLSGIFFNCFLSGLISVIDVPQQWIEDNQESVSALAGGSAVWYYISCSLVAPLTEELIFRGVIYNGLKKIFNIVFNNRIRLSCVISCIIVSVVFGIFHGNYLQALYCAVFSLFIILIYERTGSFAAAFFMHAGFNSVWMFDSLITKTAGDASPAVFLIVFLALFLIAVVSVFLITGLSFEENENCCTDYQNGGYN